MLLNLILNNPSLVVHFLVHSTQETSINSAFTNSVFTFAVYFMFKLLMPEVEMHKAKIIVQSISRLVLFKHRGLNIQFDNFVFGDYSFKDLYSSPKKLLRVSSDSSMLYIT